MAALEKVPDYIWDGESLPIPIEDIVDSCYGLHVRLVDDLSTAPGAPDTDGTLSGLLLTGPGEIWVKQEEAIRWPGRKRFTISHELGHWELHRSGQQSLFCRTASIDEQDPTANADRLTISTTEDEANAFAAALLMPSHLFVAEFERLGGNEPALCDRFNCSAKAVGHRVRALIPDQQTP